MDRTAKRDEREGLRVGIESWVAAARTEPLYVGATLYQLSYSVPHSCVSVFVFAAVAP